VRSTVISKILSLVRQVIGYYVRYFLWVLSLGILGVVIALLIWFGSTDPDSNETSLRCLDCPESSLIRVVDGDTLDTSRGRVRLFGVDTPERGESCASEATDRLQELAGGSVRLEDGPRATDSFGRLLAYVYTADGLSIDEILIREGLATAWTRDGQHRDLMEGLEREARRKDSGCLW